MAGWKEGAAEVGLTGSTMLGVWAEPEDPGLREKGVSEEPNVIFTALPLNENLLACSASLSVERRGQRKYHYGKLHLSS